MENKENSKKVLILSILGVLVLVIAVVGVSFAMYSFSATGTKANVIQTGSVNMHFDKTSVVNLTNQYPMSDAKGIAQTAGVMEYDVVAELGGAMNIDYKLTIDAITPGDTLTADYIKFNLSKKVGTEAATYVIGTATTGVALSGYSNGTTPIATGTFTNSGTSTDHYVLRAWVADNYELPSQDVKGRCIGSDGNEVTGATSTTCTGKWEQYNQTTSETFSFKVKVEATQATGA